MPLEVPLARWLALRFAWDLGVEVLPIESFSNEVPAPQIYGLDGTVQRSWTGQGNQGGGCGAAVFSPDGKRLAAACAPNVMIWNVDDGAPIMRRSFQGRLY